MPGAALLALRGCCCCRPACLLACCHLVVVLLQFTHSHARTCMLLGSNNNNTHTHFSHTLIACFPFAVHALSLSRALALSLTLPARPGLPDPGPAPWGKILLTERRRTLSPAPAHVSAWSTHLITYDNFALLAYTDLSPWWPRAIFSSYCAHPCCNNSSKHVSNVSPPLGASYQSRGAQVLPAIHGIWVPFSVSLSFASSFCQLRRVEFYL